MSITAFMQWLANTPMSVSIRESLWGYPIIETIHVLGLCLFLGFTVMLDLRLLGVAMKRTPASEVCGRLEPWMVGGFIVMLSSGVLLFYGDPAKFYGSIFMRVKFAMLILAGLNPGMIPNGQGFGLLKREDRQSLRRNARCRRDTQTKRQEPDS